MKKPAKKAPIKRDQIIVFVDSAGNYYELSRATLERSTVSERRKKIVERALEDAPAQYIYINAVSIPGSIEAKSMANSQVLRYAGSYLRSAKRRR